MKYRYLVTQPDLNAHGTLHGGILMKWVDEACGMEARLETQHVCATRHIKGINFTATARCGDIIEITVRPDMKGTTSITYSATVKNASSREMIASFDRVTFVAVDASNNAVKIN